MFRFLSLSLLVTGCLLVWSGAVLLLLSCTLGKGALL
ncbi:hypothetical protein KOR42_22970 [Thalassoglobus neptunius]|uniref:Uncharacterized protein n=1 Tax=Thalassoglobus neptunius TaxID=1938619 RepID=A0A5C5X7I5_9PLAN|nr:hypothetical protein KOR42_22970 [Thalassoglobus neptunius]